MGGLWYAERFDSDSQGEYDCEDGNVVAHPNGPQSVCVPTGCGCGTRANQTGATVRGDYYLDVPVAHDMVEPLKYDHSQNQELTLTIEGSEHCKITRVGRQAVEIYVLYHKITITKTVGRRTYSDTFWIGFECNDPGTGPDEVSAARVADYGGVLRINKRQIAGVENDILLRCTKPSIDP